MRTRIVAHPSKCAASLLYEAGATPPYVMNQAGHTSATMAPEVYAKVMERRPETGERMDELVWGADWAVMGTNGAGEPVAVAETENGKAA
jgi:hypothetical protein